MKVKVVICVVTYNTITRIFIAMKISNSYRHRFVLLHQFVRPVAGKCQVWSCKM